MSPFALVINVTGNGIQGPNANEIASLWYCDTYLGGLLGARRTFKGQVHVRLSPEAHEDVAKDAFEKGTSISGIVAQSLMIRRALKNIDPWKTVVEIREANKGVDPEVLNADITKALKAVRKKARV